MKTAYMQNKHITQFDGFVKTKLNEVETDVFMAQKGFEQYLATRSKPSRKRRFLWLFLLLLLLVPASLIFLVKNNGNSEEAIPSLNHTGTGTIPAGVQPPSATVPENNQRGSENSIGFINNNQTGSATVTIQNKPVSAASAENTKQVFVPLTGNNQNIPDTGTETTNRVVDAGSVLKRTNTPPQKDSVRIKTIAPQKEDSFYIVW